MQKKPQIKFGKIQRIEPPPRRKTAEERREAGIQKPRPYKRHYKETVA